jgi:hypothetical protein
MYESVNFGSKFSLRGRDCNILAFEDRNREEIDVCIAFMNRKSKQFLRFYIKYIKVIGVSLELMELK